MELWFSKERWFVPTILAFAILFLMLRNRRSRKAQAYDLHEQELRIQAIQDSYGVEKFDSSEAADLHKAVQGTWALVSYKLHFHGPVTFTRHPLGSDALGLLLYTSDGFMSAQVMRNKPLAWNTLSPHLGLKHETSAAATNYLAYSGRFRAGFGKQGESLLVHWPEVSLFPNWLGGLQIRLCELKETEMTLEAHDTPKWNGMRTQAVLRWRKCSAGPALDMTLQEPKEISNTEPTILCPGSS